MNSVMNFLATLSEDQLTEWSNDFAVYASVLGLQMANKMAPCTLHPAPIPHALFELGKLLAPVFNILCDRIEHHPNFLRSTLGRVVEVDDFTRRLLKIYEVITKEGIKQKLSFSIDRSDYMMHNGSMKQVELNTICSAFAGLSEKLSTLHRFLLNRAGVKACLPINQPLANVAKAFAEAIQRSEEPNSILLMVVQPDEKNSVDQRSLEVLLSDLYHIRTLRRTLNQILASAALEEDSFSLIIDGTHRAGVVYFRAGYTPRDYPSESEWSARLLIERSRAIKCPTIAHHLAGTKKVQQSLCVAGVLEALIPEYPQYWSLLRSVFAKQYGFDPKEMTANEIQEVISKAISEPEYFVLKPQREGGGNNFFGTELADKLKLLDETQRLQYVLMEKFQPTQYPSIFFKDGKILKVNSVSEFGFFSIWLGDGTNPPVINDYAGLLVRSKQFDTNEGGVAAGYAFLDTAVVI